MYKKQQLVVGSVLVTLGLLLLGAGQFPAFSAASHIVISEVQIAGTSTTDEFVELHNPTGTSVDITGWRLTRKTSTGTQSNLVASLSGIIPPGGYFLVTHSPLAHDGSIVPDAFYSAASNNISTNNTVVLYSDAGTTRVDAVGLGTASDREGTSITNPEANGSVARSPVSEDTDNNSSDFVVLAVSDPQNSTFEAPTTPTASPTAIPTTSALPTNSPSPSPTSSSDPTASPTPTSSTTPEPETTPIVSPTPQETITPTPIPTVEPTHKPEKTSKPMVLGKFHIGRKKFTCRFDYEERHFGRFRFRVPHLRFERD